MKDFMKLAFICRLDTGVAIATLLFNIFGGF